MLTKAMAKQLSDASAHECIFVDFLSEEELKKVYEALKHPGWVDAMQDKLNQFARIKPYIQFLTCLCARYQANPKESHLIAVKRIFRMQHGQEKHLRPLDEPNFKRLIVEVDFISKCCLKEAFTRALNRYKMYLSKVWYTTMTLDDSKVWISFLTRGVRGEIEHMMPEYKNKELTINPTQVFSVYNLTLKPNQPKEPPFTDHMKAIWKLDVPVDSKALKFPHKPRRFPKEKSLELNVDLKENDLQNTHLSPPLRHLNPKLANQKRKQSPVWPRTKAQAILLVKEIKKMTKLKQKPNKIRQQTGSVEKSRVKPGKVKA
nr:uncharacterized mitochondrial protein AtMg00810-like [Tanacetum cinerariifolium]